jgi:glycerol-3-phosphate dehydrogenase (NAD(P)+)
VKTLISNQDKEIVVIGAGSYGTALALHWHKKQKRVTLVTRTKEKADHLISTQKNESALKDISLQNLSITSSLDACKQASIVVLAIPSQAYETSLLTLKKFINPSAHIVIASKGLDIKTGRFLSDLVCDHLKNEFAIWSGPQFAHEVAKLLPSAVTLASSQENILKDLIEHLSTDVLRIYPSQNIISVQIAGALKNVIAIACGIARGLNLGENAIAALQTRGLAEIRRLGHKMGGDVETFLGLCGVGDLVLTCSSLASRNTQLGMRLAHEDPKNLLKSPHSLAEGIYAVQAAYRLSIKHDVYMPISKSIYRLLYENDTIENLISSLLEKPTDKEII